MNIAFTLVLVAMLAWAAWWWFIARSRPIVQPLVIDENDPLLIEARKAARDSIPQMLELFKDAKKFTRVKIPFVSNSGETEHLWAELLSVDGSTINVRYSTPPLTHTGKLERFHTHSLDDVEDWIVTKNPKRYVGGYSMKIMFIRGREAWGNLPPELLAEEAKYE